jgi:hypothetical protein
MDTFSVILIVIIVVAVGLLIQRLMAGQQNPYSQQGPNRPQYNDPNITSHGGFGGNQQQGMGHRTYDDPNIESHGGFGSGNGGSGFRQPSETRSNYEPSAERTPERQPETTRRNDDPNINSHGGFGGQR